MYPMLEFFSLNDLLNSYKLESLCTHALLDLRGEPEKRKQFNLFTWQHRPETLLYRCMNGHFSRPGNYFVGCLPDKTPVIAGGMMDSGPHMNGLEMCYINKQHNCPKFVEQLLKVQLREASVLGYKELHITFDQYLMPHYFSLVKDWGGFFPEEEIKFVPQPKNTDKQATAYIRFN